MKMWIALPRQVIRILILASGIFLLLAGGYWIFHARFQSVTLASSSMIAQTVENKNNSNIDTIQFNLPNLPQARKGYSIPRKANLQTIIPPRKSQEIIDYVVTSGDSVFEIANKFHIKPETVLWVNYDQLKDNPDLVSIGMALKIPPADGVYYQVKPGDNLQKIAGQFDAHIEDILAWSGNGLDLTDPQLKPDSWIFLPGGHREFRQWLIPVIPRGSAGVSKSLYGGGACEGSYDGAYGTGSFVWPAGNHTLSGNDYWSGHLGIDIAAGEGAAVYAADSGVVVFSGWATGGYGNTVMIDHGNGYQTLYAHLGGINASCGRSVSKGQVIAIAGNTGNSTGPHLHFEVRYLGGFVSPWFVLPAP